MVDVGDFLHIKISFYNYFGDPFDRIDHQILKFCHFFGFAAYSLDFTALSFGCFLTLKTKHTH